MECFGLEGTFRGHPAQPPCGEQGHFHLGQVAQSSVQPGLECFQGWGIKHLFGQLGPGFLHPQCKKFLPYIQSICPATSGSASAFDAGRFRPIPVLTSPTLPPFTQGTQVLLQAVSYFNLQTPRSHLFTCVYPSFSGPITFF